MYGKKSQKQVKIEIKSYENNNYDPNQTPLSKSGRKK